MKTAVMSVIERSQRETLVTIEMNMPVHKDYYFLKYRYSVELHNFHINKKSKYMIEELSEPPRLLELQYNYTEDR